MAGTSLGDRMGRRCLGESLLVPHHTSFWPQGGVRSRQCHCPGSVCLRISVSGFCNLADSVFYYFLIKAAKCWHLSYLSIRRGEAGSLKNEKEVSFYNVKSTSSNFLFFSVKRTSGSSAHWQDLMGIAFIASLYSPPQYFPINRSFTYVCDGPYHNSTCVKGLSQGVINSVEKDFFAELCHHVRKWLCHIPTGMQ